MLEQMVNFFVAGYYFPKLDPAQVLAAVLLAAAFGAAWFAAYWTNILRKPSAWVVLVVSALLTWAGIAFIQIPLQSFASQGLAAVIGQAAFMEGLVFAAIPAVLVSGLVQEAAKLAPVIVYRRRAGGRLEPRQGLLLGAVSGFGFGVFEAVWVNATILGGGWTWDLVGTAGPWVLLGFFERLVTVGLHIGLSAFAGWGLASGRGWRAWLVAAGVHGLANYGAVLLSAKVLDVVQVEAWVLVWTALAVAVVLWLRYRRIIPAVEAAGQE